MSAGPMEPSQPNLPVARDAAQAPRSYRAAVIKRRVEPQQARPQIRATGGRVRPARRKVDPAEELRKETLARVAAEREAIARIDRMTLAWNDELASTVPSLGTVVSRAVASIVGEAPREDIVHSALKRELARVRTERAPVLRVSANEDAEENGWVRRLREKGQSGATAFEVKPDEAVGAGRCVLELGARRVELSPETQLATFDDAVRAQSGKLKPRVAPPLPDVEIDQIPDLLDTTEETQAAPTQPRRRSTVRVQPRRSVTPQRQSSQGIEPEPSSPPRRRAVLRHKIETPVPTPIAGDTPVSGDGTSDRDQRFETRNEEFGPQAPEAVVDSVLETASDTLAPSAASSEAIVSSGSVAEVAGETVSKEAVFSAESTPAETEWVETDDAGTSEASEVPTSIDAKIEGADSSIVPSETEPAEEQFAGDERIIVEASETTEKDVSADTGSEADAEESSSLSGLAAIAAFNARHNALQSDENDSPRSNENVPPVEVSEVDPAIIVEADANSNIIDVEAEPIDEASAADEPAQTDSFDDFDALELGDEAARFEAAPPSPHPDRPWGDGPAMISASETGDATGSQAVAELRNRVSRTAAVLRQGSVDWEGAEENEAQPYEAATPSSDDNLPRFRYASRDEAAAASENAGDAVRRAIAERPNATKPSSETVRTMRERLSSEGEADGSKKARASGGLSLPPRIAKLISDVRKS